MDHRECECCAEFSLCAEVNYLWICEKCVRAYEIEFEDYKRKDIETKADRIASSITEGSEGT